MKPIRFLQAKDGHVVGDVANYPSVIADKWIARGIATADLTPPAKPKPKREVVLPEILVPVAQVSKGDDAIHLDLIVEKPKLETRPPSVKQTAARHEPKQQ